MDCKHLIYESVGFDDFGNEWFREYCTFSKSIIKLHVCENCPLREEN